MSGKTKLDVVKDGLVAYFDAYDKNTRFTSGKTDINGLTIAAENLSNSYEKKYKSIGRIDYLTMAEPRYRPTYNSVGKYWSFDGGDDYFIFSPDSGLNFLTPTLSSTISFWLRVSDALTPTSILLSFVDKLTTDIWYMGIQKPGANVNIILIYDDGVEPNQYVIDTGVENGQWLNICYVNTGLTVGFIGKSSFYVNGEVVDSEMGSGYSATMSPVYIGTNADASDNFFYGDISNFMIYNRQLSATEVLQNYNAIKYRFGL